MKKALKFIGIVLAVIIVFLAFSNPSADKLKESLPAVINISASDMKNIQVGKRTNFFLFSTFIVKRFSTRQVDEGNYIRMKEYFVWSQEYLGIAGNFFSLGYALNEHGKFVSPEAQGKIY